MAKILIVRLGAMGDILHALPAATAIRAALPNATIGWLVEERWSELLTAQGRKASPIRRQPAKAGGQQHTHAGHACVGGSISFGLCHGRNSRRSEKSEKN